MMNPQARTLTRTILSMASVAAIAFTAVALAGARMGPPAAPVVAVIDLEEALKSMTERVDREAELGAKVKEKQAMLDKLKDEIEQEEGRLKMEPDTPAKLDMARSVREKTLRAKFERDFSQNLIEEQKSQMLRQLYLEIEKATREVAASQNISLVLTNDERLAIPGGMDEAGTTRAITLKRIMYADKSLDITTEVVQKLNNEWAAKGGKGVAAPVTPPPAKTPAKPGKP